MTRRSLRARVGPHWIEVKYVVLGVVLIGVLITLDRLDALGGLDSTVVDVLDASKGLSVVGMFLVALVSNCAVLIQVPYTLPLLSRALSGAGYVELLALGVAAGIGAGFGEIVKYHVADRVLRKHPRLHRSRLYRWVERQARERPRRLKWIVFVWAASVIPDDTVVIPLAMIRYGIRRVFVPLFLGKVLHNLVIATVFFAVGQTARDLLERGLRIDLAALPIVVFLIVVAYQVERAVRDDGVAEQAALPAPPDPGAAEAPASPVSSIDAEPASPGVPDGRLARGAVLGLTTRAAGGKERG